MSVNIFTERQWNPSLRMRPLFRLEKIAHDHFGLDEIGDFDSDGTLARNGGKNVDPFGLERGGDVVTEGGDLFQTDPGGRMQFVAGDRGTLRDVAERHFDIELRKRVLHQARI